MNKYVVVSLVCDRGPEKDKNAALREELTGSVTNPVYVIRDPFDLSILGRFDYLQAKDANLGQKLERLVRRFEIRNARRAPTAK